MTSRQQYALNRAAAHAAVDLAFLHSNGKNDQAVTKAEASALLRDMRNGTRPSDEYIDALGRDPDPVRCRLYPPNTSLVVLTS